MRGGMTRRLWTATISAAVAVITAMTGMTVLSTASAAPPLPLGDAPETAAGSCWQIHKERPTAPSGAYWLLTPQLPAPGRFYCDMQGAGGGWVLIAKGRDGWTQDYVGKGDPSALLSEGPTGTPRTTTQLPSATVTALLGGARVDQLAGGVRIRRAVDTTGSTWQEVRAEFARRDRWAWTFGAPHPMRKWRVGSVSGSGGITKSFGSQNSYNRVTTWPRPTQSFRLGFAFGDGVAGSTSDTSFLWSATDGVGPALPYAEVYIRPRVTSTDKGFRTIRDAGTTATNRPQLPENRALDSPWGVTGIAGAGGREGNVEVQALAEGNGIMYVAGNFAEVEHATSHNRVAQPFLAAFRVSDGEWVSSFRPRLNEQVRALAVLPSGAVVAGGDFTEANDNEAAGLVALNPTTGATDTSWTAGVDRRGDPGSVRTLKVHAGQVYVGGRFNRIIGGDRDGWLTAPNLARVTAGVGTPSANWRPWPNGTVNDVDVSASGARLYAAGFFARFDDGRERAYRVVSLTTSVPAARSGKLWNPTWSHPTANYQRAIAAVGQRIYVGGAQHSLFGFAARRFQRRSAAILNPRGDIQDIAVEPEDDIVFAGCHCNSYSFEGADSWPDLGSTWRQADYINWVGAWRASTGARLPQWTPSMRSRLGSGIWAIQMDSTGTLWAGGDITQVTTRSTAGRWSGGFARWPSGDATPPPRPSGLALVGQSADTVTLKWQPVSDPSGVTYHVLRGDRPIASTTSTSITVPRRTSRRYFVRAIDGAGNMSASTRVLTVR